MYAGVPTANPVWVSVSPLGWRGFPRRRDGVHRAGHAEVREKCVVTREQDVLGFDVAVHESGAMRVVQRAANVASDAQRVFDRELVFAPEPVAEAFAFHVRHGEPELAGGRLAGIVDAEDVRVLELGRERDLAPEPLRAERRGELRVKNLESDRPAVLGIVGEVDRRHPAASEDPLDRELRAERGL